MTLDEELAEALDRFVASRPRNNRSEAMEAALAEKVGRLARTLLVCECARADPEEGKALAEKALAASYDALRPGPSDRTPTAV